MEIFKTDILRKEFGKIEKEVLIVSKVCMSILASKIFS